MTCDSQNSQFTFDCQRTVMTLCDSQNSNLHYVNIQSWHYVIRRTPIYILMSTSHHDIMWFAELPIYNLLSTSCHDIMWFAELQFTFNVNVVSRHYVIRRTPIYIVMSAKKPQAKAYIALLTDSYNEIKGFVSYILIMFIVVFFRNNNIYLKEGVKWQNKHLNSRTDMYHTGFSGLHTSVEISFDYIEFLFKLLLMTVLWSQMLI